ncbi:redoxin domain-containing protein [Abyssalbus ytuae]|uniref:Redoxin domain-containing protein n=1 Tax=Abyssalbus ytuae TaxID=2926907 RepID=A0A9E6ZYI4_9FLAO|nr:redoxin domain-containing protein [Abyssalbus ytuae]UOB19306.1 redoxin domain-containing protein [Abyssalbus ytuae]
MNAHINYLFIALIFILTAGCKHEKKEIKISDENKTEISAKKPDSLIKKPEPKPLEPGTKAPDFNLPGIDGKNYTLSDFNDYETLVVLFTCNHCPTAQAYEEKFIQIVNQYQNKNVGFLAISPNATRAISLSELGYSDMGDSLEEMKLRANQKGYNFPYLYDGDTQQTSLAYGPLATPHVFVFNKERILKYSGRIDDTENPYIQPKTTDLINVLDALTAGKEVTVNKTKTFGCSVKWSWKNDWVKKQKEQWAEEPVSLNEISLPEVGEMIKNDSDKLRLINFWATWCGPCVMEFPELININRMYRDRDFEFISVTTDKMNKKEKALELLKKKEASNVNYIYSGNDVYELIEAVDKNWQGSLPYTVLIAPGGEVLYKVEGTFDPPVLKKTIVDYLGRYYADNK